MRNNQTLDKNEVQAWINKAMAINLISPNGLDIHIAKKYENMIFSQSVRIYASSKEKESRTIQLAIIRIKLSLALLVFGLNQIGFSGHNYWYKGTKIQVCQLNSYNANILRRNFIFTRPSLISEKGSQKPSIGVGDRLGIATPGHIRLLRKRRIFPVFAQQSVRELTLTERTFRDVLDAATWAVFQEGYMGPWGADGDHLKSIKLVKEAVKLGYTLITADVSEHINEHYTTLNDDDIVIEYNKLSIEYRNEIEQRYLDLTIPLDINEIIEFSKTQLARIVLIYKDAINHAKKLYEIGKTEGKFDFELSIDETSTPTLPQAHIFIAIELKLFNIELFSIAPRFIGEFQKGIDYIGNIKQFKESFKIHASIARFYGHRLSIHSGSDKFTIYPIVNSETRNIFHLKTAGTNWLESLKVIAQKEPNFYRKLHKLALIRFPETSRYYTISPNLSTTQNIDKISDSDLVSLFDDPNLRQILHVSYGEILRSNKLKTKFFEILEENITAYWKALENHIGTHLESLGIL